MDPKTIIGSETFKYFAPAMGGMVVATPLINLKYLVQTTPREKLRAEIMARAIKPHLLFRGLSVNMMFTPAIAMIGLAGNYTQKKWEAYQEAPLSPFQKVMNMVCAGSLVSLAQNPMDLVVINLNKEGMTVSKVVAQLTIRNFLRGYALTAGRESGFGIGVYALVSEFRKYIDSNFLASILAAAVVAPLTQPLDTVKTVYQSDMHGKSTKTIRQAFHQVRKEGKLMSGLIPRFVTIAVFTATISELTDQIKKLEQKL